MDLGSLADWVAAIGGLLAAASAMIAWKVSRDLLDVERQRDDERARHSARKQAELVCVLGAKLPQRSDNETWSIYIYNGSDKPIFDVEIGSQRLNGTPNHPLTLGSVPPGRWVVPSHPNYHWGSLTDLSLSPEPVDFLVKGRGMEMITQVSFRDAARRPWQLRSGTELVDA